MEIPFEVEISSMLISIKNIVEKDSDLYIEEQPSQYEKLPNLMVYDRNGTLIADFEPNYWFNNGTDEIGEIAFSSIEPKKGKLTIHGGRTGPYTWQTSEGPVIINQLITSFVSAAKLYAQNSM